MKKTHWLSAIFSVLAVGFLTTVASNSTLVGQVTGSAPVPVLTAPIGEITETEPIIYWRTDRPATWVMLTVYNPDTNTVQETGFANGSIREYELKTVLSPGVEYQYWATAVYGTMMSGTSDVQTFTIMTGDGDGDDDNDDGTTTNTTINRPTGATSDPEAEFTHVQNARIYEVTYKILRGSSYEDLRYRRINAPVGQEVIVYNPPSSSFTAGDSYRISVITTLENGTVLPAVHSDFNIPDLEDGTPFNERSTTIMQFGNELVRWTEVPDATAYQVQITTLSRFINSKIIPVSALQDSSNPQYLIANVKQNVNDVNPTLTDGEIYKVYIKALKGTAQSRRTGYSTLAGAPAGDNTDDQLKNAERALMSAEPMSAGSAVQINWKSMPGAGGYQLYLRNKTKGTREDKTVWNTNDLSRKITTTDGIVSHVFSNLTIDDEYDVMVRGIGGGILTNYTNRLSFTVEDEATNTIPTITEPGDTADANGAWIRWNAVDEATSYLLEIREGAAAAHYSLTVTPSIVQDWDNPARPLGGVENGKTYRIFITAKKDNTIIGETYTKTVRFEAADDGDDGQYPTTPLIEYPDNNEEYESADMGTAMIRWGGAEQAATYQLIINKLDLEIANKNILNVVIPVADVTNLYEPSYEYDFSEPGEYGVIVTARNSANQQLYRDGVVFTVIGGEEENPTLTEDMTITLSSPASTGVSRSTDVFAEWVHLDGATSYEIETTDSEGVLYDTHTFTDMSAKTCHRVCNSFRHTLERQPISGQYTLRIRGKADDDSVSGWTTVSFTKEFYYDPPATINVEVGEDITITWPKTNATEASMPVTTYKVQIVFTDGNELIREIDVPSTNEVQQTTRFSAANLIKGRYTAAVRPEYSIWSEPQEFIVGNQADIRNQTPQITSPIGVTSNPVLVWSAINSTDDYQIEVTKKNTDNNQYYLAYSTNIATEDLEDETSPSFELDMLTEGEHKVKVQANNVVHTSRWSAERRFTVQEEDGDDGTIRGSAGDRTGDVDEDNDFDANDANLMKLVTLGAADAQINAAKGGSSVSASRIRTNVNGLGELLDVNESGRTDANDADMVYRIMLASSDAVIDSIKGATSLSASEIRFNTHALDVDDNRRENTGTQKGDVDKDGDFDANDAFLTRLVMLSVAASQLDQVKGASTQTANQIIGNVHAMGLNADVDGDGDFDANDAEIIHIVKLAGTDAQINGLKGASTLSATQIRAKVTGLDMDTGIGSGDVDEDNDFDANDANLMKLVTLGAADAQINAAKGGSSVSASRIRTNVNGLGELLDVNESGRTDANDADMVYRIMLASSDAVIDSIKGATSLSASEIRFNTHALDVDDNRRENTGTQKGDVDKDGDFDANDAFLTRLVMLSVAASQLDQVKGASTQTANQIIGNVHAMGLNADVDGDGDFDANDAEIIHIVKLAGTDAQINGLKGASTLSATQIRAKVTGLDMDTGIGSGDVDEDNDFDANDANLMKLVTLGAADAQINAAKGGSSVSASRIRTNVNGLGELLDVNESGRTDANDADMVYRIMLASSDAVIDSIKGATSLSASEIRFNTHALDVDDNRRENTGTQKGDVDKDGDFDANDAFLTRLVMLSVAASQLDQVKGASTQTANQIIGNVHAMGLNADVDGDGDFDANDAEIIHIVKLAGTDAQINGLKGASTLSATQIRAKVTGLDMDESYRDITNENTVTVSPIGTVTSQNVTFTWRALEGATRYYVWVSRNGSAVHRHTVQGANTTTYQHTLAPGQYTYWVRAQNPDHQAKWSSAKTFTIQSVGGNSGNSGNNGNSNISGRIVNILAPSGTVARGNTFTRWNKIPDATTYQVWIGKLNNSGQYTRYHIQNVSGEDTNFYQHSFTAGQYKAWVQASNNVSKTRWSVPRVFTVR